MNLNFQELILNFRMFFDFLRFSLPILKKGRIHDRYQ